MTRPLTEYRLYTVVPRLVRFIGQLTNWYVRLNRRRIKVLPPPTHTDTMYKPPLYRLGPCKLCSVSTVYSIPWSD